MISIPVGMGDLPCGYDICFADDIRFAYEGNGYYIILAKQVYHTAQPYIILHQRYFIGYMLLSVQLHIRILR